VAAVCEAFESRTPVYPIGGATSLDFGLPPKGQGLGLSLAKLDRIVDYPARDMTVTVEAGVTMQSLTERLAKEGQRLPVDVPLAERATVGGVIATNWNGPRRYGEGSLRDFVIGISAIDGRGQPFKGGGRVVKNVAGYDFCKLLTGSLGVLGVITQVTLKLRPIPQQSVLLACSAPDLATAERVLAALVTSEASPMAIELLAGPAWRQVPSLAELGERSLDAAYVVVGLEGAAAEVEYMIRQLSAEWRTLNVNPPIMVGETAALWQRLFEFPQDDASALVLKASVVPSGVTDVVAAAREVDPGCSVQAHAGNGNVIMKFATFPAQGLSRALVGKLQPVAACHHGHLLILSNPSGAEMTHQSVWGATDAPLDLMREVKRKFDPKNILNPGRFVV
jgi:glycolate oxidase FAD binding subunit